MEVHVSQLVPGCILTEDVIGKTNYPMIYKNTVLNKEHILILEKFLVEKVAVSRMLADGKQFIVQNTTNQSTNKQQTKENKEQDLPFYKIYEQAVTACKKHYTQWKNGMPLDILEIREFLIPLMNTSMDAGIKVYQLHQYATKEDYIYHHSISLAILSSFLARKMGFEKGESIQIGFAGFLSNIGMVKIDQNLITEDRPLTDEEQKSMRTHPIHSYYSLQPVQMITDAVKLAVLQHHERLDGSGYPLGLKGNKIHRYAKIIAVCDIYHAMTSGRFYQKGQSPFKVMNELKENKLTTLDPLVVEAFIQSFIKLAIGEKVKLSNAQVGKITFIDQRGIEFPLVLLEEKGNILSLAESNLSIIDFT